MKQDETIDQWCERRVISHTTFYAWEKIGRAPVVTRIGKVARITARNDEAWERDEARRAKSKEAKREAERRSAQAAMAARIAAKSPRHISNRKRQGRP